MTRYPKHKRSRKRKKALSGRQYKQPRIDISKKLGSFSYFLSIPCSYVLSIAALISLVSLLQIQSFDIKTWALFTVGLLGSLSVFSSNSLTTVRTLIHELKHALVVVISGNKLRDLQVSGEIGHVEYDMYQNRVKYAPFIALAPYFFPFFSLFTMIAALFFEWQSNSDPNVHYLISAALGVTLAADLSTAYQELHPHQSDLLRMSGGKRIAYLFLLGTNSLWLMLCLLWIQSGMKSYIYLGYNLVSFTRDAIGI